ncbi:MAG: RNA methyltransferase [bacterium]
MQEADGQRDPRMQMLRELQTEAGRRKHARFTVEEAEMVRRAMDLGAAVETIIVADAFARTAEGQHLCDKARSSGLDVCSASPGLIGKMLGAKPIPDCAAIVRQKLVALTSILQKPRPLLQMVEHCESADNLGMLLRSTDAAGTDGVILSADTTDPFSRRAVRGSRGAVFTIPLCIAPDTVAAFDTARRAKVRIVATSASATTFYSEVDYTGPTLIVVGNEHTGLSRAARESADIVVRIPMLGRIHSLNIAVAASIMLFEATRQRSQNQRTQGAGH